MNHFYQKSAIELRICEIKNAEINLNSKYRKYEKKTISLRSTIEDAIVENISKRRSCNQSKVWWSQALTNKRKIMTYSKRQWKNFKTQSDWDLFKRSRNDYFHKIRDAKNKSWKDFLNNAKRKEVVQAYKYTKPRSVEKLSSILHNYEMKIHFEEKCDAIIEAIFPSSFEDIQKRPSKDLLFDEVNKCENRQHRRKWEKVIHREIKNVICSSSLKRALNLDRILFLILQKSYYAIFDLFNIIFSKLIKNEYHLQC